MQVTRIHEDPRVTLPYTEEQWSKIEALGHRIDQDMRDSDVRLTMGGEPTFVSIDNMDGPEWNTDALSAEKLALASTLMGRLQTSFAPGALMHHGQGKWYPGEPLPRWALGCYWRNDGIPMWRNLDLFATDSAAEKFGTSDAKRFADTLAQRLGLDPKYVNAAFEDSYFYEEKERLLPVNTGATDSRPEDDGERKRIAAVFQRGVHEPVGYVLPIKRVRGKHRSDWQTSIWPLRTGKMLLTPGDSPIGLRLPLSSLPWVDPKDVPEEYPDDPTVLRAPLPVPQHFSPDAVPRRQAQDEMRDRAPAPNESAPWIVRKALCVQAREGKLFVFMPPAERVTDYLDLLAAVEDTAAHLQIPVVIEGYTPPYDARISNIKVTPDPGVIEVNIHPARNWPELVRTTTTVYDQARLARLGAEKFMLDGRHTGTGGGNHFVLGAMAPTDSPFLRRPDLLRSMITYWLNHPSLSYMFSGMFHWPHQPGAARG